MAFTDLGSLGATGSTGANQTSLVLTTTAAVAAGELVVVFCGADNIANSAADGACASIANSGTAQTWSYWEVTNTLAAQAGTSCKLFYCVANAALASGTTFTVTFGSATLVDASAMVARHFSVGAGQTIATPGATTQTSNTALDPASHTMTTANITALRIRAVCSQVGNNTNLTPTASWTAWANGNSATTGTTAEICVRAEHRIVAGTSVPSDPTYVSAIYTSVYAVFQENYAMPAAHGVVAAAGQNATLTKSSAGGTLWTPADLGTTPQVVLDGTTVPWSGSNFATVANPGSWGGNIIANQGTVIKGTAINGYDTLAFNGAKNLKTSIDDIWPAGDCFLFSVLKSVSSNGLAGCRWITPTSGWAVYPKMASGGGGGGHSWAAGDSLLFGSGNSATVNHTIVSMPSGADSNAHIFIIKTGAVTLARGDGTVETEPARAIQAAGNATPFTDVMYIGSTSNAVEYHTGDVAYFAAFNPAPSDADIEKLEGWAAHKYGLTANLPAGHPYKSAAPTTGPVVTHYTMPATVGTLTLSGQAAVLRDSRRLLVPAQGSLTLAGQAAVTRFAHRTAGGLGTLTLSGQDVTLTKTTVITHYTMPAGLGTVMLFGPAVGTKYGHKMPAGLGTLTLAGQAAVARRTRQTIGGLGTLTLSGQITGLRYGHKTAASLGTLTLAGQAATLRYARRPAAGLGVLTLSGLPAGLVSSSNPAKTMIAGTGGLVLAGQAATFKRNYVFPSLTGTITLSGRPVAFRLTRTAGLGTLTLGGQSAVLRYNHRTIGGLGTIALSGQPVALPRKRVMPVTVGTITLGGQNASLLNSSNPAKILPAGLGTIALAGQPAAFKRNYVFPHLTGTLTLSGQANILRYGHRLVVTHGTLTIGGQIAALRWARMGPATHGTIALSGQPATLRRSRVLQVTFGTLTLAGQPTTLRRSRVASAGLGTIQLFGPVVNLISSSNPNKVLPAGLGFPAIAGQAAILRYNRVLNAIGQSTITLAGQTARARYGHAAVAGTGTITLTGLPASLVVVEHVTYTMPATTGRIAIAAQVIGFGFTAQPGKMVFGRKAILRRW